MVITPEVVGRQEQEHAATGLIADEGRLLGVGSACKKQSGAFGSRRRNQDPPLVLRGLVLILDESKVQRLRVVGNRLVVVTYDKCNVND
jgi:hypothetical protein